MGQLVRNIVFVQTSFLLKNLFMLLDIDPVSNFFIDYIAKGFDNDPTICEHGPKQKIVDIVW